MDRTIEISDFPSISIFEEEEVFSTSLELISENEGVYEYQFSLKTENEKIPEKITLRWRLPALNVKGVWKCGGLHDKRLRYDWELDHPQSRISVDAPIISVFGHDDENVITFACSDAVNLLEMNVLLREEDAHLYCHLTFFSEAHPEIKEYTSRIIVDTRPIRFSECLQNISKWWEGFPDLKPSSVPELARVPLYSTWYNFHQSLEEDLLLKECMVAVEKGLKLIILDDGWQTMDNNRGYDYTGDWQPDRFPDLADFVSKVHAIGMKFGLWFSVPFCGKKSKAYKKFKGKFLIENHRWAPVFDPRYPEVRQHLIDIYVNALKTYKLDAFKLDFIDDFKVYPETVLTKENGRDYANVNEAVGRLLSDVMTALREIKPDVAIEFRQKYIGPAMRRFGNMFRAFDCPNDPVSNRIRITDVKLLCGNSAVHSDMLIWHKEEKVELAAQQVLNGIFGVPQISILLTEYPEEHVKMVGFYTKYWSECSEVLMGGHFTPYNPLGNYPLLKSEKDGHMIAGVYDNAIVEIENQDRIDLLNGKMSESILIKCNQVKNNFKFTVWNCLGEVEHSENISISKGIKELKVKASGMIRLERIN